MTTDAQVAIAIATATPPSQTEVVAITAAPPANQITTHNSDDLARSMRNATIGAAISLVVFFTALTTFGSMLILGLLGGLDSSTLGESNRPNQGIIRSASSAIVAGLLGAFIGGSTCRFIGSNFVSLNNGQDSGLLAGLCGIIAFGLMSAMALGGYACLSHLALRIILSYNGFLPFKLVPFLDYCVDRIFLRRIGGSYIFIHRLLMEHFALLYLSNSNHNRAKDNSIGLRSVHSK